MSERRQLSSSTALFFMTTAKPPKVGTERLLRGERHAARTAHRVGWCCLSGRKSSLVAGVVGCRVWTMRKIILSLASSNTRKECDVNLKRCCYAACPSSPPYKIGRYISNQRGDRWICYVFDRHAIYILGVHQLQDYVFQNIYHQKAFMHCSGLFRVHDSQE